MLSPEGQWWRCFIGFLSVGRAWSSGGSGAAVLVTAWDPGAAHGMPLPSWIAVSCAASLRTAHCRHLELKCRARRFCTRAAVTPLKCSVVRAQCFCTHRPPRWCSGCSVFALGTLVRSAWCEASAGARLWASETGLSAKEKKPKKVRLYFIT